MAHLAASSTEIFSPSVARVAALTAKDWKYVDDWLATKFRGRKPPPFERNSKTLKALLALASLNETADEERQLVARAESSTLRELQAAEAESSSRQPINQDSDADIPGTLPSTLQADILNCVEDNLTHEGHNALDAMSSLSVDLGIANPTPESLAHALVNLHAQLVELQQTQSRINLLDSHVQAETSHANNLIIDLDSWRYAPSPDLPRQNLDLQRKVKAIAAELPGLEERLASFSPHEAGPDLTYTITRVARDEAEYLGLIAKKKLLEDQITQFAGLPDDADAARRQLEQLRSELRTLRQKRDAIFEGLVERETPRKKR